MQAAALDRLMQKGRALRASITAAEADVLAHLGAAMSDLSALSETEHQRMGIARDGLATSAASMSTGEFQATVAQQLLAGAVARVRERLAHLSQHLPLIESLNDISGQEATLLEDLALHKEGHRVLRLRLSRLKQQFLDLARRYRRRCGLPVGDVSLDGLASDGAGDGVGRAESGGLVDSAVDAQWLEQTEADAAAIEDVTEAAHAAAVARAVDAAVHAERLEQQQRYEALRTAFDSFREADEKRLTIAVGEKLVALQERETFHIAVRHAYEARIDELEAAVAAGQETYLRVAGTQTQERAIALRDALAETADSAAVAWARKLEAASSFAEASQDELMRIKAAFIEQGQRLKRDAQLARQATATLRQRLDEMQNSSVVNSSEQATQVAALKDALVQLEETKHATAEALRTATTAADVAQAQLRDAQQTAFTAASAHDDACRRLLECQEALRELDERERIAKAEAEGLRRRLDALVREHQAVAADLRAAKAAAAARESTTASGRRGSSAHRLPRGVVAAAALVDVEVQCLLRVDPPAVADRQVQTTAPHGEKAHHASAADTTLAPRRRVAGGGSPGGGSGGKGGDSQPKPPRLSDAIDGVLKALRTQKTTPRRAVQEDTSPPSASGSGEDPPAGGGVHTPAPTPSAVVKGPDALFSEEQGCPPEEGQVSHRQASSLPCCVRPLVDSATQAEPRATGNAESQTSATIEPLASTGSASTERPSNRPGSGASHAAVEATPSDEDLAKHPSSLDDLQPHGSRHAAASHGASARRAQLGGARPASSSSSRSGGARLVVKPARPSLSEVVVTPRPPDRLGGVAGCEENRGQPTGLELARCLVALGRVHYRGGHSSAGGLQGGGTQRPVDSQLGSLSVHSVATQTDLPPSGGLGAPNAWRRLEQFGCVAPPPMPAATQPAAAPTSSEPSAVCVGQITEAGHLPVCYPNNAPAPKIVARPQPRHPETLTPSMTIAAAAASISIPPCHRMSPRGLSLLSDAALRAASGLPRPPQGPSS